jgi:hypothetical protein
MSINKLKTSINTRIVAPVIGTVISVVTWIGKNLYWITPIVEYAWKKIKELINKKSNNGKRNSDR